MAGSMANKGVSAMKTKIDQFQFIANSDSAGGHRHGQTTKSDIMFMIDQAGRYADQSTVADMHAAGGASDSA